MLTCLAPTSRGEDRILTFNTDTGAINRGSGYTGDLFPEDPGPDLGPSLGLASKTVDSVAGITTWKFVDLDLGYSWSRLDQLPNGNIQITYDPGQIRFIGSNSASIVSSGDITILAETTFDVRAGGGEGAMKLPVSLLPGGEGAAGGAGGEGGAYESLAPSDESGNRGNRGDDGASGTLGPAGMNGARGAGSPIASRELQPLPAGGRWGNNLELSYGGAGGQGGGVEGDGGGNGHNGGDGPDGNDGMNGSGATYFSSVVDRSGLSVRGFQLSRDEQDVYFTADFDGDGLVGLFRVPLEGGRIEPLLNRPDLKLLEYELHSSGGLILLRATRVDTEVTELFMIRLSDRSLIRLNAPLETGWNVAEFKISADASRLVYRAEYKLTGNPDFEPGDLCQLFALPLDQPGYPVTPLDEPRLPFDYYVVSDDGEVTIASIPGIWMAFINVPILLEYRVLAMATDGSSNTEFTPQSFFPEPYIAGQYPAMIPGSEDVVIVSDRNLARVGVGLGEGIDLITEGAPVLYADDVVRIDPSGENLVVMVGEGVEPNWTATLFSVPLVGGPAVPLISSSVANGEVLDDFQFTPDGALVVYRGDLLTDEVIELFAVPVSGGTPVKLNGPLVTGGDVAAGFRISPDGQFVVYRAVQEVDGRTELFRVPVGGGPAVKLNGGLVSGGNVADVRIGATSGVVAYLADQERDGVRQIYDAEAPSISILTAGPTPLNDLFVAGNGGQSGGWGGSGPSGAGGGGGGGGANNFYPGPFGTVGASGGKGGSGGAGGSSGAGGPGGSGGDGGGALQLIAGGKIQLGGSGLEAGVFFDASGQDGSDGTSGFPGKSGVAGQAGQLADLGGNGGKGGNGGSGGDGGSGGHGGGGTGGMVQLIAATLSGHAVIDVAGGDSVNNPEGAGEPGRFVVATDLPSDAFITGTSSSADRGIVLNSTLEYWDVTALPLKGTTPHLQGGWTGRKVPQMMEIVRESNVPFSGYLAESGPDIGLVAAGAGPVFQVTSSLSGGYDYSARSGLNILTLSLGESSGNVRLCLSPEPLGDIPEAVPGFNLPVNSVSNWIYGTLFPNEPTAYLGIEVEQEGLASSYFDQTGFVLGEVVDLSNVQPSRLRVLSDRTYTLSGTKSTGEVLVGERGRLELGSPADGEGILNTESLELAYRANVNVATSASRLNVDELTMGSESRLSIANGASASVGSLTGGNGGNISLQSNARLSLASSTLNGNISIFRNAVLASTSPLIMPTGSRIYSLEGIVEGDLSNDGGTLVPVFAFRVKGDLDCGPSSVIYGIPKIPPATAPLVTIDGTAELNGVLTMQLDFEPTVGQSLKILNAASIVGRFSNPDDLVVANIGTHLKISYSATEVTATVLATTSRGTPLAWLDENQLGGGDYETADLDDPDGDGQATWEEFVAGTDPNDYGSTFWLRIEPGTRSGFLQLRWPSIPGRVYQVLHGEGLTGGRVLEAYVAATPPENVLEIRQLSVSKHFYRVSASTFSSGWPSNVATVFKANSYTVFGKPLDGHLRTDGELLDAISFGTDAGTTIKAGPGAAIEFTGARAPNPSGPNWSATAPRDTTDLTGQGNPGLYNSVAWSNEDMALTFMNLDPTRRYLIQIAHSEPRAGFAGSFGNNEFVTGNGISIPVPNFRLGNSIANQSPPAMEDLALVNLEIFGESSIIYHARVGTARGPDIAAFQIRDITVALPDN